MHPDDLPTITKRQADKMVADAVAKSLAELKPVIPHDAITGGVYTSPVLHEPDAVARSWVAVKKPEIVKPVPVVELPLAVSEEKPVMPPAVMDEAWTDGEDDAE